MKTFKDLKFEQHPLSDSGVETFKDLKQATENFENGYGVSILLGSIFYSNGKDTYEVAILFDNNIAYNTGISNDVLGYQTKQQVTDIMKKVQSLK